MSLNGILTIYFRISFSSVILIIFILTPSNLEASECGILKMQKYRNSGVQVANNYCTEESELSLNTILQIPAGARLWLESTNAIQKFEDYQIICQNNSSAPLNIKIDSPILPWISPENDSHCSRWINNRLECQTSNNDEKTLLCAIAQIRKSLASTIMQRKTSFTLRGLNYRRNNIASDDIQIEADKWKAYLKPEIDLCRKVFQVHYPITMNWKIRTDGKVTDTSITETNFDNQFVECAIEVIKNFSFPAFEKDIPVTLLFD